MGLLLPLQHSQFQLNMTMKLQVMSNEAKIALESRHCNGNAESVSVPTVSVIDFEDIDALKNKMKVSAETQLAEQNDWDNVTSEEVSNKGNKQCDKSSDFSSNKSFLESDTKDEASELRDLPHDDTDATISVSSDTTLEPESFDNHNRMLENNSNLLTTQSKRKWNDSHASSSVNDHQRNHTDCAKVMQTSAFTDDLPVDVGDSARFSKVLENISLPLLYIPTTKQLVKSGGDNVAEKNAGFQKEPLSSETDQHFLYVPNIDYSCNGSESGNSTLDLSSYELSNSNAPMHKAHSAQEFHYMGKYTDSDRFTLHSVDSFQGFHPNSEPSSYLFADNSSLSSVSTGTDFSVSAVSVSEDYNGESKSLSLDAADEAMFMDINLHSRNSFDKGYNSSSLDSGYGDKRAPQFAATKKKTFTGLKNFFAKRSKDESPPGWKLFGRIPPKPTSHRNAQEITSEFQARQKKVEKPHMQSASKKQSSEVMSTTALILENRPTNLPSKSPEEAEKHRQLYEEMIAEAKKKEQKDLKLKKKQLQMQRKLEDQLMAAARVWDTEILPNWESMRNNKKARDLWWMGLPPSVRGRVWQLAIGNDLNITHALYDICHERAEERIKFVQDESSITNMTSEGAASLQEPSNKESSVKVIKLDVSRTFPHLCIFQKGGPFYDLLHNLLGAYACYRPDVGYVQGMSFIAAILLLNMDVADAFVCFANLLNRPCQLAFFRMDENLMTAYYKTFEEFFKENLPKLFAHFTAQSVTPNLYLMEWVFLLYSKSLPLDVACRVWDVFFRDGEEFLFRTAIAILKLHEIVLLRMDFIHIAQFLTKLPEDINTEHLFKELETVKMHIDKRGFHAVHGFFKDLHASNS